MPLQFFGFICFSLFSLFPYSSFARFLRFDIVYRSAMPHRFSVLALKKKLRYLCQHSMPRNLSLFRKSWAPRYLSTIRFHLSYSKERINIFSYYSIWFRSQFNYAGARIILISSFSLRNLKFSFFRIILPVRIKNVIEYTSEYKFYNIQKQFE